MLGARRRDKLTAIAASINTQGGEAVCKALDVTQPDDIATFAQFAVDQFGTLDVFVNNAGLMPLSMIYSYKIDE